MYACMYVCMYILVGLIAFFQYLWTKSKPIDSNIDWLTYSIKHARRVNYKLPVCVSSVFPELLATKTK